MCQFIFEFFQTFGGDFAGCTEKNRIGNNRESGQAYDAVVFRPD